MSDHRLVHLEVLGRVQGVGFRWFVRETARRLGLQGWVKNRADGAVELAAGGAPSAVERLVEAVRRGPEGARVTDVRSLETASMSDLPRPFAVHRE